MARSGNDCFQRRSGISSESIVLHRWERGILCCLACKTGVIGVLCVAWNTPVRALSYNASFFVGFVCISIVKRVGKARIVTEIKLMRKLMCYHALWSKTFIVPGILKWLGISHVLWWRAKDDKPSELCSDWKKNILSWCLDSRSLCYYLQLFNKKQLTPFCKHGWA